MQKNKLIIIGGGAAGLLCAGFAARRGIAVTVVDKNARPGRKLQITGKGRCNVTNNCTPDEMIAKTRTNPRFLYSAYNAFPPERTMALFEEMGVPLKTERGRRVFPVSDQAADVVQALAGFAKKSGATLLQRQRVDALMQRDGHVCGVRLEDGTLLEADAVVIATGGLSYPLTGSTGDGYRLAESAGHTIVPTRASLVSIDTKEKWCVDLAGLALKNITLTLQNAKKKTIFHEMGELLFTHTGISGPLVLSASAYLVDRPQECSLSIDLKPALDPAQLDARILRDFSDVKNKDFANALDHLLPRTLVPIMIMLSGIPSGTKVHSITKEQRQNLVMLLKGLPLTPKKLGTMEEAVITAGGVSVKEIDPATMQSKLLGGLFFAGEVIDVDAFTGGYNLQIAWSTAYLAAHAVCTPKEETEQGL